MNDFFISCAKPDHVWALALNTEPARADAKAK